MRFTKMHGLENDYIFVETFTQSPPADPEAAAAALSNRHTGIGGDGLILIMPHPRADAEMRIYNADGSLAQICGNGLRCAARLLYDSGLCRSERMTIMTGAGPKPVRVHIENDQVTSVTADMGEPKRVQQNVPLTAAGRTLTFALVDMGNPHAITFEEPALDDAFYSLGPAFERCSAFPERTNVEFARVLAGDDIHVRVWERGSGETRACGSGACASLVAAASLGLCGRTANVTLPGGTLRITWRDDNHVLMNGPATPVFHGEV